MNKSNCKYSLESLKKKILRKKGGGGWGGALTGNTDNDLYLVHLGLRVLFKSLPADCGLLSKKEQKKGKLQ